MVTYPFAYASRRLRSRPFCDNFPNARARSSSASRPPCFYLHGIRVYVKDVLRHHNGRNSHPVRIRVIATSGAICRFQNPGNRNGISNNREIFEERDIASKASNIIIPNCISEPHGRLRGADAAPSITAGWRVRATLWNEDIFPGTSACRCHRFPPRLKVHICFWVY